MNEITEIFKNPAVIITSIFLVLLAFKETVEVVKYICNFFGLKTKSQLEFDDMRNKLKLLEEKDEQKCKQLKLQDEKIDRLLMSSKIQTRNSIISMCENALNDGEIEFYTLQSLEDMYQMYTETLGGNSYATTMINKVRHLKVVKKHDGE